MIASILASCSGSIGVRGSLMFPSMKPIAATAAFTGIGFTSQKSAFTSERYSHCTAAAPATSPAKYLSLSYERSEISVAHLDSLSWNYVGQN